MQAVILAAGQGTRMRPLTLEKPKPLIEAGGVPLIERIAASLPPEIDSVIVVVGYLAEMIEHRYPAHIAGRPVQYVVQAQTTGTFDALSCAKDLLQERFLVVLGDDLQSRRGLAMATEHPLCVIAYEHPTPERFGVITLREDGTLAELLEKPLTPPTNLISTGAMVLDPSIFAVDVTPGARGERYLSEALSTLAKARQVAVVRTPRWVPVGTLEELALVEDLLARGDDPTA